MLLNNRDQILHCFPSVVENLSYCVSQCFVLYWRKSERKNYRGANMTWFVSAQFVCTSDRYKQNICPQQRLVLSLYKCIYTYLEIWYLNNNKKKDIQQLLILYGPIEKLYNYKIKLCFSKCFLLSLSLNVSMLRFSLTQTIFLSCCIPSGDTF